MNEKVLLKIPNQRVIIQKTLHEPVDCIVFFTENNIYLANPDKKSARIESTLKFSFPIIGPWIANKLNRKRLIHNQSMSEKTLPQILQEGHKSEIIHYSEILKYEMKKNISGEYVVIKTQKKKYYLELSLEYLGNVIQILKKKCVEVNKKIFFS